MHVSSSHHPDWVASAAAATLVLGGIGSGKSAHAESLALALTPRGCKPVYLATANAELSCTDPQMRARLERHRRRRGDRWHLVEDNQDIPARITDLSGNRGVPILVDSLGFWLMACLEAGHDVGQETQRLIAAVTGAGVPVILVSDEVGLGGVAAQALARDFADHMAEVNRRLAQSCGCVIWMVAGVPTILKPRD